MENIQIDPKRRTLNEFKSKKSEEKIKDRKRNTKSKT